MLRFIFKRYRTQFENFFVEELIGDAPADVKAPVFDLLKQQRDPFMKWLVWNSWNIQKRMANDENRDVLRGVLLFIRVLMSIAGKESIVHEAPKDEKKLDPMTGIEKFKEMRKQQQEAKNLVAE